jgi:hypothetical protein
MTSKRLYFGLLTVIGLLLIGLLAGVYGTNRLLSSEANTLTGLKAKSQALTEQQEGLASAKKDIQKYASLEAITKAVVPQDKNQAEAVRELANIAAANNVSLGTITFPSSTLGTATTGTATTGTATPVPVAASNSPSNTLSQLLPVTGIPGVYQLTISVASDSNRPVQYNAFINFLAALEQNRRTAQVTSISLTPTTANPNYLTFTLNLNEYIKP